MGMHSGIVLSQASSRPMFAQITDQAKRLVASGQWPPGFEIPSIRTLAAGLEVSVITVKRAYAELEVEGVITTHQGKPSIVAAEVSDLNLRLKEEDLAHLLRQTVEASFALGLAPDQLREALNMTLGEFES